MALAGAFSTASRAAASGYRRREGEHPRGQRLLAALPGCRRQVNDAVLTQNGARAWFRYARMLPASQQCPFVRTVPIKSAPSIAHEGTEASHAEA